MKTEGFMNNGNVGAEMVSSSVVKLLSKSFIMIYRRYYITVFLITIMLMVPFNAKGYDFMVDGLCYNINSGGNSVTVTQQIYTYSIFEPAYSALKGDLIIPSSVTYRGVTYEVTTIGDRAFYGCRELISVVIPNSVTTISDAFGGCCELTSVSIPNSVTIIGSGAFYGCVKLTNITIPNSVKKLGGQVFERSGLTSVIIPSSVISIGTRILRGCRDLVSIKVESGNTKYDSREGCNAIIETASNSLIEGCKSTIIPNSVTSIGSSAFSDCSGLTSLVIPNSVISIGSSAFYNCSGLTSVVIPNSVTSIEKNPFYGCSNLQTIIVETGNSVFDSRNNCNAIIETASNSLITGCKSTIIPNNITTIDQDAFRSSGLTSVVIPNSVTTIGKYSFSGCRSLKNITIPNSVSIIEEGAFEACLNLKRIESHVEQPTSISLPTTNFCDHNIYTTCLLYVPLGTKSLYRSAPWWRNFTNIVEVVFENLDLNGDGVVDRADYTLLVTRIADQAVYNSQFDLDGNGQVDVLDANLLLEELDKPQPVSTQTYTVNGVSFTMVGVQGGTFTMGASDDEEPAHQVTLSSYSIGQTEVTQELWQAVMNSNPSKFNGGSYGTNLQRPVEQVSWEDCQEFITKLNQLTGKQFRLPTEAEWEYAARGGNRSEGYTYAGSSTIGGVAWYEGNSLDKTHDVATKPANELGLYDMSGNVREWCQDWYGSYSSDAQNNPTGPASGSNRVNRGGSWFNYAGNCRVSTRYNNTPADRFSNLGFRLAQ